MPINKIKTTLLRQHKWELLHELSMIPSVADTLTSECDSLVYTDDAGRSLKRLDGMVSNFEIESLSPLATWNEFTQVKDYSELPLYQWEGRSQELVGSVSSELSKRSATCSPTTLTTPSSATSSASRSLTSFLVAAPPTVKHVSPKTPPSWCESSLSPVPANNPRINSLIRATSEWLKPAQLTESDKYDVVPASEEQIGNCDFPPPPLVDDFNTHTFILPPPPLPQTPPGLPRPVATSREEQQLLAPGGLFKQATASYPQQCITDNESSGYRSTPPSDCASSPTWHSSLSKSIVATSMSSDEIVPTAGGLLSRQNSPFSSQVELFRGTNPVAGRRPSVPQRAPSTCLSSVSQPLSLTEPSTPVTTRKPEFGDNSSLTGTMFVGNVEATVSQPNGYGHQTEADGSPGGTPSLPIGEIIRKFDRIGVVSSSRNIRPGRLYISATGTKQIDETMIIDSVGVRSPVHGAPTPPPPTNSLSPRPSLKRIQSALGAISYQGSQCASHLSSGDQVITPQLVNSRPVFAQSEEAGHFTLPKKLTSSCQLLPPTVKQSSSTIDRKDSLKKKLISGASGAHVSPSPGFSQSVISYLRTGKQTQGDKDSQASVLENHCVSSGPTASSGHQRRTSASLNRSNAQTPTGIPVESLRLEAATLATLMQYQIVDANQIPGYQQLPAGLPDWKLQRLSLKNREAAEAYAVDLRKWGRIPQWKRELIEKRNHINRPISVASSTTTKSSTPPATTDIQEEMHSLISGELTRKLQRQLEKVSSAITTN